MNKVVTALAKRGKLNDLLDDPRENNNLVNQESPTSAVLLQPQKKKERFFTDPTQRKIITWTALGLGLTALGVTAFLLVRSQIRKRRSKKESNVSAGSNKHATWAKQIKNSFDNNGWWGTDEVLLRNTLRAIPSDEDWQKVIKSYAKIYKGRNLVKDMTGELKQTEYNEMVAILRSKPKKAKDVVPGKPILDYKGWAKRINAAINYNWLGFGWGTDEEAVKAVFIEMPTQNAYWKTKAAYRKMYGVNMYNDLKGDMDDIHSYLKIVWRKPKT